MEGKTLDCMKVGALLYKLRKEKGVTQKQIADMMCISDKTISKWERGLGCPDVSLLKELSNIFEVDIEKILEGELENNITVSGNLKRMKFHVCPSCGNVITNSGNGNISCCGRRLPALSGQTAIDGHIPVIEEIEEDYYVTFDHDMIKSHFISFVAFVNGDRFLYFKLYPEQSPSVRLPRSMVGKLGAKLGGKLYYYCTQHGLWVY